MQGAAYGTRVFQPAINRGQRMSALQCPPVRRADTQVGPYTLRRMIMFLSGGV